MNKDLKPFKHIIKILFERDGWLDIPLVKPQEEKIDGKVKHTAYNFPNFLHLQTDSRQSGE
jgi:hypothetical protein